MNVFALGPCALAGLAVASASDDPRSEGVQAFFCCFHAGGLSNSQSIPEILRFTCMNG